MTENPGNLVKFDEEGRIPCLACLSTGETKYYDNMCAHLHSAHGISPSQYQKLYATENRLAPLYSQRYAENMGFNKEEMEAKTEVEKPSQEASEAAQGQNSEDRSGWANSKEAVKEIRKKYDRTSPERVKEMANRMLKGVRKAGQLPQEEKDRQGEFIRRKNYATTPTHFLSASIPGRCFLRCQIRQNCQYLHPNDRTTNTIRKNEILPPDRFRQIRENGGEPPAEEFMRLGDICPIQQQEAEVLLNNYITKFDIDLDDPTKMTMVNILVSLTIQYSRASKFLSAGETVWLGDKIVENVGRDGSLISQTLEKVLHPVTAYQEQLVKQIKSISNEMMLTPMSQKTEKIQITTDFSAVLSQTRSKLDREAEEVDYQEVTSDAKEGDNG